MAITDHPGFLQALAESDMTASEATVDVEMVRASELTDTQEQPEEPAAQSDQSSAPAGANECAGTSSDENPAPITNPQPNLLPGAGKAGDVPPPSSPAPISEADVPAFLKADKKPNPKCRMPGECKWDHGVIPCWRCNSAPAASETEAAA
jgi:hypothetical protein